MPLATSSSSLSSQLLVCALLLAKRRCSDSCVLAGRIEEAACVLPPWREVGSVYHGGSARASLRSLRHSACNLMFLVALFIVVVFIFRGMLSAAASLFASWPACDCVLPVSSCGRSGCGAYCAVASRCVAFVQCVTDSRPDAQSLRGLTADVGSSSDCSASL